MDTNYRCLAELLYMVACYRRHNQSDKAIKILQDIIALRSNNADKPEAKRVRAICVYNLASIYEDYESTAETTFVIARELYIQAADLWNQIESNNPMNLLWYLGAMQGLQAESDRLIILGASQNNGEHNENIA